MENALPRNIYILYYSYTTGNLPPFNAFWKDVPVSVVFVPSRSTCFAVNLVQETGAARSVYAANASRVRIALAHRRKSSTLYPRTSRHKGNKSMFVHASAKDCFFGHASKTSHCYRRSVSVFHRGVNSQGVSGTYCVAADWSQINSDAWIGTLFLNWIYCKTSQNNEFYALYSVDVADFDWGQK